LRTSRNRSRAEIVVVATCVAVAAMLCATTVVRARQAPFPDVGVSARSEAAFAIGVATRVRSHGPEVPVHLRWRPENGHILDTPGVGQLPALVALALEQRGTDVTVDPRFAVRFGPELAKRPRGPKLT